MRIALDNLEKLVAPRGLHCVWELAREGSTTRLAAHWVDCPRETGDLREQEEVTIEDDTGALSMDLGTVIEVHVSILEADLLSQRIRSLGAGLTCCAPRKGNESCNASVKSLVDSRHYSACNLFDTAQVEVGVWHPVNCTSRTSAFWAKAQDLADTWTFAGQDGNELRRIHAAAH